MKNVLIVEDDENKRQQIAHFVSDHFPDYTIQEAKSFHSGLRDIISGGSDLILLDMTMPTYDIGQDEDGGRPQHFAGRDILRQMDRRSISIPVIIVTQFDVFGDGADTLSREKLDEQLRLNHSRNYVGTVYYNAAMDEWKPALLHLMSIALPGDE